MLKLVQKSKVCPSKTCEMQGRHQPIEAFYRHKSQPDGLTPRCKSCCKKSMQATYIKHKSRYNAATKAYREKDREKWVARARENNLKSQYGISAETWNAMFAKQNGCCKICNIHSSEFNKPLAVDHCHSTGQVRGLLCYFCNWMIGNAKDNIQNLKNAISYLEEFNG